jgi:CHRD domain
MGKINLLLCAVITTILAASLGYAADKSFHAKLSGHGEKPAVTTKAKGEAVFKLSKDGKELSFKLTVKDMENVTAAHIHQGKKGENGPVVVGLFAGPKKEGKFSGVLAEGTIMEKDLKGDLQGKSLDALLQLIKSGGAYVNVHTDAHPDGEIRGQVK